MKENLENIRKNVKLFIMIIKRIKRLVIRVKRKDENFIKK